jgi:hypothetical protein
VEEWQAYYSTPRTKAVIFRQISSSSDAAPFVEFKVSADQTALVDADQWERVRDVRWCAVPKDRSIRGRGRLAKQKYLYLKRFVAKNGHARVYFKNPSRWWDCRSSNLDHVRPPVLNRPAAQQQPPPDDPDLRLALFASKGFHRVVGERDSNRYKWNGNLVKYNEAAGVVHMLIPAGRDGKQVFLVCVDRPLFDECLIHFTWRAKFEESAMRRTRQRPRSLKTDVVTPRGKIVKTDHEILAPRFTIYSRRLAANGPVRLHRLIALAMLRKQPTSPQNESLLKTFDEVPVCFKKPGNYKTLPQLGRIIYANCRWTNLCLTVSSQH